MYLPGIPVKSPMQQSSLEEIKAQTSSSASGKVKVGGAWKWFKVVEWGLTGAWYGHWKSDGDRTELSDLLLRRKEGGFGHERKVEIWVKIEPYVAANDKGLCFIAI